METVDWREPKYCVAIRKERKGSKLNMGMTQDGGGAVRTKSFPVSWDMVAKPCDYCKSAAALLFCRDESAFICISCDAKVHDVNQKHERVWMCEVCEQAPAVVTCKADAASLCLACDRDIHSANPLARRHDRTPIVPFHDTAESVVLKSAADNLLVPIHNSTNITNNIAQNDYLTTTDSWIRTNNSIITTKLSDDAPDIKSLEFLFSDSDQFLDFENYQISSHPFSDSMVPVQTVIEQAIPAHSTNDNSSGNRFEIDFTISNLNSYNNSYTTASSLSQSVSSSSMEMGIVPDGCAMSDISYPFARNMGSIADLSGNQSFPVVGLDREARVLRYREKRKNRKFQKTIRYASRKAYAESRPRIKGRFAKRNDGEPDIDGIFISGSANFICDARYGVVPSF